MPENSPQTASASSASFGVRLRNLLVVTAAMFLAVAVVLGVRTQSPSTSLSVIAQDAEPYEQALINHKPTFLEFYANWCTSCQAMAPELANLKSTYGALVNFVMLNVDNSKWLPEMVRYRVDGIPHFVYLNAEGEPQGTAIGEQPRSIIAENLEALLAQQPLPNQQAFGRISDLGAAPSRKVAINDDPRSHGAQVQP